MSIKETIESMIFFSSLNKEQIELLSSFSTQVSVSPNYIVHYEKKESGNLLFLTNGLAKAYKIDKYNNEIFLYYIYKNSLHSEISDIKVNTLYSFSNIEIVEESTLLSINYQNFVTNHPTKSNKNF